MAQAEAPWASLPTAEALARVGSARDGLAATEAEARLEQFGPNRLRPPRRRGPLKRFLLQFHNVLIYVLLAAGVVTALLGHAIDSGVIFGVVVINALIGFVQEGKAEQALDAIRNMLSLEAMVLRDGQRLTLPAEDLVPGDVVFLQSGDKVPADLRLLQVKTLQAQEAALTGESVPVGKQVEPVAAEAPLGDRASMAYAGTLVSSGQGCGVVVATGDDTEIGRIGKLLREVEGLSTPLTRQLADFAQLLSLMILGLAAATFAFGTLVYGFAPSEMFLAAVALAVAAVPEGLPAIVTIALAIGVQRMARRNAIIRQLPAVETLGSVSVICSDKTGTLTRNEMMVQSIATRSDLLSVDGEGYVPRGAFRHGDRPISPDDRPILVEIARGALLCSDAGVRERDEGWIVDGDPMEGALVVLAMKAGLDPAFEAEARPRTDVIPFEAEHRFMATLHHDHDGHGFIYVKGAPERLMQMCGRQQAEDGRDEPLDAEYWTGRMEEIAGRGQRLLALAIRRPLFSQRDLGFRDVESGLTLLGLLGLADPPRHEAIAAVARCRQAGVRVIMITGDHAATASAIGGQLGLEGADRVLTGQDLRSFDDAALAERVETVNIFARTTPEDKLRLVGALQARGRIVAMTGDGVNDAPALKRADVGVAMGHKGTEAAKEAADMVLADDNFATIAHAVEEGRTVYDNLRKSILFVLPTNGAQAFIILAAVALGEVLPITAVQILWVNMISAVTLALALAFEAAESDVMRRPPRHAREPLLSGLLVWRVVLVSAITVVGSFGLFLWEEAHGASVERARTVAVNTLVMFEVFYLFNSRRLSAPILNREGLFGSRPVLIAIALVLALQLAFTYAPPLQNLFASRAIDVEQWLRIVTVASSVLFLIEIEKAALRRLGRRARQPENR